MPQKGKLIQVLLSIVVIAVTVHLPFNAIAEEECGPYDGVDLTNDPVLLEKILLAHKEWLADTERREDDPRRANLCRATLSKVNLFGADLSMANLSRAKLSGAILLLAELSESSLFGAKLNGADLSAADLSMANLSGANLSDATLLQTDLTNARVNNALFYGAQYEPISVPSLGYLSGIKGLSTVWFDEGNQGGLVLLRAAIKETGLRELEREATFAIEHGKTSHAPWIEKWLKLIFLEWTSGYGLNYARPLGILLVLIIPFAAVYYMPIATPPANASDRSGIYRIWPAGRVIVTNGRVGVSEKTTSERLYAAGVLSALGYAFYFSLLSAFHIGWRDLNVGNWITRIQPREYTLRAKGWIRTVSGIQSLISIYLLALWVLVYFGRPFE